MPLLKVGFKVYLSKSVEIKLFMNIYLLCF